MKHIIFFAQQLLDPSSLPHTDDNTLGKILDLVFKVLGALALLFLVIAAFRMVISSGEPQKMAEVRRQIIFIVIGLVLAASADLIVNTILNKAG
jgi:hypothetical protein